MMKPVLASLLLLLALMIGGPAGVLAFGGGRIDGDWSTATHRATGQAPDPAATPEAVVQVYAARAFAWRGLFAVHTWVAVKPAGLPHYTRFEVIGWNVFRGGKAVVVSGHRAPDAEWFGARPWLLADLRGEQAQAAIDALPAAVASYPWPDSYVPWPGPNSNTFIAHLAREIPMLNLTLPPHALGKDYLGDGWFGFAATPSGTGWQVSVRGLFGLAVGLREGLELNLLGLVMGLDPLGLGLKLPGLGTLTPKGWR